MFNTLVKRTVTYAVKTGSKCGTTVPRAVIARNASNRKRVAIDGNEAAAHSIYQVSDAAMLFPITPLLEWESIAIIGLTRVLRMCLDRL